jgi:benzoate/toluate 1,2-dioxygenase reductase subunit
LTCTAEKSDKHPQGYVNQWITKNFLGDLRYDAYICGPPPMVEAIQKTIAAEGISVTNVFVPY